MALLGLKPGAHEAARRHRLLAALAVVGLTLSTVPPAPGQATPRERHYTYVALDVYVAGPDLAASLIAQRTGRHLAPLGTVHFVPHGRDITVTIDDEGTVDGMLDISIGQRAWQRRCVPVRQPIVIDGLTPGERASLTVWSVAYGAWSPCGVGGTAGTLTISG